MTNQKRVSVSLLAAFAVGVVLTFAFPPPKEANAQVFGPTTRTPLLTVSPGETTVEDLTVNGTCTGCGAVNAMAAVQDLTESNDPTGFSPALTSCSFRYSYFTGASASFALRKFSLQDDTCTGTSNATTMTLEVDDDLCTFGFNELILPIILVDNGTTALGRVRLDWDGDICTMVFGRTVAADGGFTASGTKGILPAQTIVF